jgi:hypothetical protein
MSLLFLVSFTLFFVPLSLVDDHHITQNTTRERVQCDYYYIVCCLRVKKKGIGKCSKESEANNFLYRFRFIGFIMTC